MQWKYKKPEPHLVTSFLAGALVNWKIFNAALSLYNGLTFNSLQQEMMSKMNDAMSKLTSISNSKDYSVRTSYFPYHPAIVLILCPAGHFIFDAFDFCFIFHFYWQIRAGLTRLIYNKTYYLRMTGHSNVNTVRLMIVI